VLGFNFTVDKEKNQLDIQFMKRTDTEQGNILIGRLRAAETKNSYVCFQSQFFTLLRQALIAEDCFCCVANLIHETKRHTTSVSRLSSVASPTQLLVRRFMPPI
jgi:hypothetical protein